MKTQLLLLFSVLATGASCAAQTMSPEMKAEVDATIEQIVQKSGVPSASVGIVLGGGVVYTRAFGEARLQPPLPATAAMAYPVGSITKQFTAVCILLLEQDGKLKLDDPVGKWFPGLTRANDVTLRELLSHTSGYEDYAPQDYTIPRVDEAHRPGEGSGRMGGQAARFRTRHRVAVQQHQLHAGRADRPEGERHAVLRLPPRARSEAAAARQCDRSGYAARPVAGAGI